MSYVNDFIVGDEGFLNIYLSVSELPFEWDLKDAKYFAPKRMG